MNTRDVSGVHLRRGDVIVAPDGGQHTVTDVELCAPVWAAFDTDSGYGVCHSWDGMRANTYAVLR